MSNEIMSIGMMNAEKIKIFENPDFGKVRSVMIEGEPWFVGKDIAEILGYSNSRKALADHVDEDDKNTVTIRYGNRGNPNQIIINESGLYSLLFTMQPQKANHDGVSDAYPIEIQQRIDKLHRFKRWVTSNV